MDWQEIRKHYPQQWLLLEALQAHTEANKRILERLAVVNAYSGSAAALKEYSQMHRSTPERELYVFHTGRETLDVTERHGLGMRLEISTTNG